MRGWLLSGVIALVVVIGGTIYLVAADGDRARPVFTSPPRDTPATGPDSPVTGPGPPVTRDSGNKARQDRATQASLRNALTAEKVFYTDTQRYTANPADLSAIESSLEFTGGIARSTSAPEVVHVVVESPDDQIVCVSARSPSGELFMIKDVARGQTAGTWYERGTRLPADCDRSPLEDSW